MPARTLSPLVAADRASLSPPRYPPSSPSSAYSQRRRDSLHQDDSRTSNLHMADYSVGADTLGRLHASAIHMHFGHNALTPAGFAHIVPPVSMQRHTQWPAFPIPPPPHPLSNVSQHPVVTGWLPHPPNMSRLASPQILHKVWIVDCQSCGMFFTNRGMKAVLLLRPHVPLYSTDALPVNCSAQSMTAAPSSSTTSTTSRQSPETGAVDPERAERVPTSRTCECLTQTLWCHGCGASVGYMIVVPCIRCTSSTAGTNRTTNGHRFVFYSSEIAASERHHVAGESGIVSPAFSPRASSRPPTSSNASLSPQPVHEPSHILISPRPPSTPNRRRHTSASLLDPLSQRRMQEPLASPDNLSPPPLEPVTPPPSRPRSSSHSSSSLQEPEPLKPGEVLYWHHLIRHGEIPAVADDPRARNPQTIMAGNLPETAHGLSSKTKPDISAGSGRRKAAPMAGC
ncbi:hypothetical protein BDY19DRAFT_1045586 [Irpex rosettiformis]|uniref:Uncharacterized protein n=1 Tax=Irpex rosettiformis TaxID=378272 RepID=A0ACB8UG96_9APHY|nr:hypothetical protein BDY19DRAFT_1045586 [Irpex rosettiformis]